MVKEVQIARIKTGRQTHDDLHYEVRDVEVLVDAKVCIKTVQTDPNGLEGLVEMEMGRLGANQIFTF